MLQKILVAVDGSEYSKKALVFAGELAQKFDASLHIVHVPQESAANRVVIGSRGLGDFGGLLLGSVSHKVNHSASCTCITVH